MNYSKLYNLQPGDRVIEPLFETGLIKHHAIFLGSDFSGVEWIAENQKNVGVRVIAAPYYFKTIRQTIKIEKFSGTHTARKKAVQSALQSAGKPYDLINYNCEHFVNEALTGISYSRQISNIIMLIAILLFWVFATKD